ncbi:MAG TPA: DUF1840 domain-containing protein [Rubrivivax sp.]|nr:DUF1840 domain-containing protein [Rubrivivax sp.]
MLITFKSKAAAEIIMYQEHAKRILDMFGKDVHRGVITAAESAPLIARLEKEIAESRLHQHSEEVRHDVDTHHGEHGDDNDHEPVAVVDFHTRAYPLLEMMRAAHQGGHDILWGV